MDAKEVLAVMEKAQEGKGPARPGWKTSEWYLTVAAAAVGAFLSSGALPDAHWSVRVAGVVAMVLATLGYQVQRTKAKGG